MSSHPLHGPDCSTRTFPANCRECSAPVFVFTCSCGSGVLFEKLGSPWPQHDCEEAELRGVAERERDFLAKARAPSAGKSSPFASLKTRIDIDRLSPADAGQLEDIERIAGAARPGGRPAHTIKRMTPVENGEQQFFIGVLRERASTTVHLDAVYGQIGDVGRRMLDLPGRTRAIQLTIVDAQGEPNESYTAIADRGLVGRETAIGSMVGVTLVGCMAPGISFWRVTDIQAL